MLKVVQEKGIHFHLSPKPPPTDGLHGCLAVSRVTVRVSFGTGRVMWLTCWSMPKEALASTHPQAWTVHHLGNLPVSRPAIEKWVALNPLSATLFVPPIFSHIHTITHFPFDHHLHHPSYLSPYPYLHISIPTKLTSHTSFPTVRSPLFCFLSYPAVKMF